ncbi:hypothetical protein RMATCC62417_03498 [Rhizopus microsporus]|nr:hypothetical protein RMATCC62417_03498 [Rhizopus microsporus]
MHSSKEEQIRITIYETTLTVQQNTLSVFHVIIQTPEQKVSLVRYPFDFVEFHQKIRFHYPKVKISFPTLHNPSQQRVNKRRSIQHLLFPFSRKSNAEKLQKYLERCFRHPIVSVSSILRDFTRVQRDEDVVLMTQLTDTTLTLTANQSTDRLVIPPKLNKQMPPLPATMDDFNLIKVLGKGCMGKVLLVRSKRDDTLYALKAIQKKWVMKQKEFAHTRAERDILVGLRNQSFIVHLHHVFQTPSTLFLLLDYHPGGDIATQLSLMSKFTPERTRFYAAEIVQGLNVLHSHGIIYRDLKPENVLIQRDGHIVLTDFGLSKIFTAADVDQEDGMPYTQTFCGTAEYLAPEVLLGEPYTFVVDFWSLGTLLFEMLAGITPFWAETHMDMYRRVIEDPLEFPPSFDQDTCSLLSGLLKKEACMRLGWGHDGIEYIKAHPYFERIDWDLVAKRQLEPPFVPVIKDEQDCSHFDDVFTSMPVRISQNSREQDGVQPILDPFVSFDYDSLLIEFQQNNKPRLRKRQSASMTAEHIDDDRANKKRQLRRRDGKLNPSMTSTLNNSVYSALTVENHQQVLLIQPTL